MIKFYKYEGFTGVIRKGSLPRGFRKKKAKDILEHVLKSPAKFEGEDDDVFQTFGNVITEYLWRLADRPYYNVFPIVFDICKRMKLDTPISSVCFNWSPLLLRFPAGRNPLGIKTILVHTQPPEKHISCTGDMIYRPESDFGPLYALMGVTPDGSRKEHRTKIGLKADIVGSWTTWLARSGFFFVAETETGNRFYQMDMLTKEVETFEDMLLQIWDENTESDATAKKETDEFYEFAVRLIIFLSMLDQGQDIITPAILEQDRQEYDTADEATRKLLERRAMNDGRGFDVGRIYQQQKDANTHNPYWRDPHPALYHTGPGGTIPKIIFRQGSVVNRSHLAEVPSGHFGDETQDEILNPIEQPDVYRKTRIPPKLRFQVFRRDGFKCVICGRSSEDGARLEADHIIPEADGGPTTLDNLQTTCKQCNGGKGTLPMNEGGDQ